MVDHMKHRTVNCQLIVCPQKALHAHAHQDKTDLGHGGTGQRPLEVDGEKAENRAQQHCDNA